MSRQVLRRAVLIGLLVSLWMTHRTEASPILGVLGGTFGQGPLAGTSFSAAFGFDAPPGTPGYAGGCCANGNWPIFFVSVHLGGNPILSMFGNPGTLFHVNSIAGGFGPLSYSVPSNVLPAGLLQWSFGPVFGYSYTFPTPSGNFLAIGNFTNITARPLPPGVPEPSSLLLGLGAIAAFAIGARKARK